MVFEEKGNRLVARLQGEVIQVEPCGVDGLRFRATRGRGIIDDPDLTPHLLPQEVGGVEIAIQRDKATVRNGKIVAVVTGTGEVKYTNSLGKTLLEELWVDRRTWNGDVLKARTYRAMAGDLFKICLYFRSYDGEHFYGMGQHSTGCLDLKGCTLELAHKNTQINIPFLLSTRGYGFIWNLPSIGLVSLAKNATVWVSEAARQIDYIVIAGDTPREIVKRYTELVGRAPPLPSWALGLWQSKSRYKTQEELLGVAREYGKRNIPLSMIIIDFLHWTKVGDFRFDPKDWPDPEKMVEELRSMNIEVMVSIWPLSELAGENYREAVEKGLLIRTEKGIPILHTYRAFMSYYDFTNPETRRHVWEKVRESYYRYGIRNYWLDEAEPEIDMPGLGYTNTLPYDWDNLRYHLGNGLEVSNLYPFYYIKAFYDGLKSVGESGFVLLARAAWHGAQRFNVAVWSGDIPSTFESLSRQIKAGLNMGLCGITWWTTDIGGFYPASPNDPLFAERVKQCLSDPVFQELVVRWFQWGAFCPVFRIHGVRAQNEVWSFGDRAYRIMRGFVFIRERLKPYIVEQAKACYNEGIPLIRPLFIDFPCDENTYQVEDEYMFGSDILVAPVYEQGATSRKTYLPKGADWVYAWTKETHGGGEWVETDTPLEIIPIYLRRGSNIPLEIFGEYLETLKGG